MKKVVSLILLIAICTISTLCFALSYEIEMKTEKTEYSKDDEFVVDVNISNIKSDNGVIAFTATLNYDKESLDLTKLEGQNGWGNPSYNPDNGIFVMDRNETTQSNETILKLTFKVKKDTKKDLRIELKDITAGDGGAGPVAFNDIHKDITIKNGTADLDEKNDNNTNTVKPEQNKNNAGSNKIVNLTSNKVKNTQNLTSNKQQQLPKTGTTGTVLTVVIIALLTFAVVVYAKSRNISKK